MSLAEMTLASAATTDYFNPIEIKDDIYISGDSVASSPAMFAALMAKDKYGVKMSDITIVSIGSTNPYADSITKKVGLLDWASRLTTLSGPVKTHTMDYMAEYLLRKNNA